MTPRLEQISSTPQTLQLGPYQLASHWDGMQPEFPAILNRTSQSVGKRLIKCHLDRNLPVSATETKAMCCQAQGECQDLHDFVREMLLLTSESHNGV